MAIITGPSEVSAACPFNLSAGESYDVPWTVDLPPNTAALMNNFKSLPFG